MTTARASSPFPSPTTRVLYDISGNGPDDIDAVGAYGTVIHKGTGAFELMPFLDAAAHSLRCGACPT
ncbi:MAG: hypothetical protein SFX73_04830 [Kofleriaceae bacterium]|nr:hypothetical protein [Kofleriaceae bacterium]